MNPEWRDLSAEWKNRFKPEKQTQDLSGQKAGPQDDKA
jgi:hypothetical protein